MKKFLRNHEYPFNFFSGHEKTTSTIPPVLVVESKLETCHLLLFKCFSVEARHFGTRYCKQLIINIE